ncbi:alpha/beta hydrolase [Peterkaempfera sp. SMS 1(5)a]|uniref:alpha/beta hydrolase n=1 Tax=Peterkaempfera podocarpi TaxID=3232308 RepID=UPI0036719EB1
MYDDSDLPPVPVTRHPRDFYLTGRTTLFAARCDQRFSYCLHVPAGHGRDAEPLPLVVIQHGTGRTAVEYRDAFSEFAERHRCIVLAPLFPAGLLDSEDLHNFKFIEYRGIRFDQVLLEIVAEVGERFNARTDRFLLQGFSGGGQFAHRFFYLHPDRLAGVSIGAPGRITRLDPSLPWWLGTEDFAERFGRAPELAAMREVAVQMAVGEADTETWEINNPGDSNWMDGADAAGLTRIDRLRTLRADFERHGIAVRFDLVPEVPHDGMGVLPVVKDFFAGLLPPQPAPGAAA